MDATQYVYIASLIIIGYKFLTKCVTNVNKYVCLEGFAKLEFSNYLISLLYSNTRNSNSQVLDKPGHRCRIGFMGYRVPKGSVELSSCI